MSITPRYLLRFTMPMLVAGLAGVQANSAAPAAHQATMNFTGIPLSFEPNQGQTGAGVQFVSHGRGYSLFLAPGEAYVTLERQRSQPDPAPTAGSAATAPVDTLRMKLLGADPAASASGLDRQSGVVNYFVGQDPAKWHSGIPTFAKVNYASIYPGIDLVFYGNQQQLEYDFVVAPGADPSRIAWRIEGARLSVDRQGDLRLAAPNGPASFKKPVLYQMDGARRVGVSGRYVVAGNQVRFALGAYDRTRPLIIDPVLSYLTYIGAAASQYGPVNASTFIGYWDDGNLDYQGLAIDREGDVYVTGHTNAIDFPVKDAFQGSDAGLKITSGATAAFVTKINPQGTGLVYSTYLSGGGQSNTYGSSIAVDAEGNAYAAGWTDDRNYPTTPGAFQTICGAFSNNGTRTANCETAGPVNGFVTKLDPAGSKLVYSTYLGANQAYINSIAVDGEGRAYVAGFDNDYCDPQIPAFECFPTTANAVQSGYDTSIELSGDNYFSGYPGFAFLTVFSPNGSSLAYSTLIGDNINLTAAGETVSDTFGLTSAFSVAVNSAGEFFLTGYTHATKLPVTPSAVQRKPQPSMPGNGVEGFVAKFNPIGSGGNLLAYLTYLGPVRDPNNVGSYASGITADSEGNAYVTGITNSQMFPTTKGSYDPTCGEPNFDECGVAFVSKLNASGSELLWSTYFGDANGGSSGIGGVGPIALDTEGNVYISGSANGYAAFPQVNQIQPTRGNGQVFVAKFNPEGSKLLFSTLLGGLAGTQWSAGLAVDKDRNIYVAGNSNSPGVQPTKGAFQRKDPSLGYNAFVAKIAPIAPTGIRLAFSSAAGKTGEILTIRATVSAPALAPTPTGKVIFDKGAGEIGTATLNSSGVAELKVAGLKGGTYIFKASYPGDGFNDPSTAEASAKVKFETTTTLKSSANPSKTGHAVVFTVKVTSSDGAPAGTVTLKKNGVTFATKTLAGGSASFTVPSFVVGTHILVADYSGNATDSPSTSNSLSEVTKSAASTVR